ncbi:MAG TPA: HAMP domain-containing sensor histidine kinase [Candidatus Dormibacteraeota bacterium]|nr:HAMP domain-containing sensor histidine kinase [Candidatus Dormibacteraeota bacterium]
MTAFLTILQYTVAAAFLLLGLSVAVDALQHRERARIYLALGFVLLSLVLVIERVQAALGTRSAALQDVAVVAFLGSGFCILLFRSCFVPLRRFRLMAAGVAVGIAAALAIIAGVPPSSRLPGPFQSLVGDVVILTWVGLVAEPVVRFWLASRDRPPVQRARLRGLSVAFAVLIAILLVGTVAGNRVQAQWAQLVTQLAALGMVPVLYASLAEPGQLRRQWRASEQDELQRAMTDLLVFSPDRATAADRAVRWAARLVGADAAFILDIDAQPLASIGMTPDEVEAVSVAWQAAAPDLEALARRRVVPEPAIALPLPMEGGVGLLGALSGPFTPVFGAHEVGQLRGYASAVAAGLERVRVTERLAAMERAKGQFLNLASHELRGPVAIIRGYMSMLERGTLGPLNQAGLQAVRVMSAKALEMNALIEQMLDAARLEEGRLQLHLRPVELRSVVERAVEVMLPLADDAHPLVLRVDPQPLVAAVDVERVQTILTNLVDNAIKYSPEGGPVECRVTGDDDSVLIAVRDHGVGIAPDDLPRLFSRFGRISTDATRHIPGIGLGLYLARELAQLHGGDISVESRPGAGSTFVLALPRRGPGERAAPVGTAAGE